MFYYVGFSGDVSVLVDMLDLRLLVTVVALKLGSLWGGSGWRLWMHACSLV